MGPWDMPDTSQARRETFSQQEGGLAYPTKRPKFQSRNARVTYAAESFVLAGKGSADIREQAI